MRIDHIAYRVKDRNKSAKFFIDAFGYKIQEEFNIEFEDNTSANCFAMTPFENPPDEENIELPAKSYCLMKDKELHSPPDIFVSDGDPGSIVWRWVEKNGGTGGIHHIAYEVENVEKTMELWIENKWAEFTTIQPIESEGLVQCFTKPHAITGIIYEFIYRTKKGFNVANVKDLMESTEGIQ